MIAHGSDVHQGGDGPLSRAALNGYRVPMMELLVAHGADVNALWHGRFPIIFSPCESLDPVSLAWLLDHGANPNPRNHGYTIGGHAYTGTALDYVIGSYVRSPRRLQACIDLLLNAGGTTKYDEPSVIHVLRGHVNELADLLTADPPLLTKRFPDLDCGQSGGRTLTLTGGTLLHVAAEYGNVEAVSLLLDRGADVNARATIDDNDIGGQTALFHAVTQFDDGGLDVTRVLVDRGVDLAVRARLPGNYEIEGDVVECTALGYALRFGGSSHRATVALLRDNGAIE